MFPRVRLRRMDFLNIPARCTNPYATARYSHPCSLRAFLGIHAPKLLKAKRNIKKISFSGTGQLREYFVHYAIISNMQFCEGTFWHPNPCRKVLLL